MTSIVLIVEDDEILRSLTVEAISLLDLGVVDCASADDALLVLEGNPSTSAFGRSAGRDRQQSAKRHGLD